MRPSTERRKAENRHPRESGGNKKKVFSQKLQHMNWKQKANFKMFLPYVWMFFALFGASRARPAHKPFLRRDFQSAYFKKLSLSCVTLSYLRAHRKTMELAWANFCSVARMRQFLFEFFCCPGNQGPMHLPGELTSFAAISRGYRSKLQALLFLRVSGISWNSLFSYRIYVILTYQSQFIFASYLAVLQAIMKTGTATIYMVVVDLMTRFVHRFTFPRGDMFVENKEVTGGITVFR